MRRPATVLVVLAANVIACQLILGIGDDRFTFTPDAKAKADDAPAPEECPVAHRPPPKPDISDDDTKKEYVFAVRSAAFLSDEPDAAVVGYDLDGVCSCDPKDTSPHRGGFACKPPGDASCDFAGGVDNSLGAITSVPEEIFGSTGLSKESECGRSSLLIWVGDYNGKKDDPHVTVAVTPTFGIFEGNASVVAPGCETDGGPPFVPPRWDGHDRWSTDPKEVADKKPIVAFQGWVRDWQLVLDTRVTNEAFSVSLLLREGRVTLGTPVVTARVVPADGGPYKLEDGIMTGRLSLVDLIDLAGAQRAAGDRSPTGIYCDAPEFKSFVKPFLCGMADTVMPPDRDFKNDPCNAASMVLRFTAEAAEVGDTTRALAPSDGGCAKQIGACTP